MAVCYALVASPVFARQSTAAIIFFSNLLNQNSFLFYMTSHSGRIRITGGQWRSRIITFPAHADLRPTPDRVRETLFNWLGQDLTGLNCLDLFAGSGALGFEAASRGAANVVMIESSSGVHRVLLENKVRLKADSIELIKMDASVFLITHTRKFDVVFLDPPYRM